MKTRNDNLRGHQLDQREPVAVSLDQAHSMWRAPGQRPEHHEEYFDRHCGLAQMVDDDNRIEDTSLMQLEEKRDGRDGSISAQIRWVIEPLSLVSCSFNFGHAGDRLRHGS